MTRRTLLLSAVLTAWLTAVTGCSAARPATPASRPTPHFDVDCHGFPIVVKSVQPVTLSAAQHGTVVTLSCQAGAGSPPDAVFVYAGAAGLSPLVARLLDFSANRLALSVQASGSQVVVRTYGFSSPQQPRCCPDLEVSDTWRAQDGRMVRVSHQESPLSTTSS